MLKILGMLGSRIEIEEVETMKTNLDSRNKRESWKEMLEDA